MLKHSGNAPKETPHASTSATTPIGECCRSGSEIITPSDIFRLRVTVDETAKFEMNPIMPKPSNSHVMAGIVRFALRNRNGVTYVYEEKCAPKTSATISMLLRGCGRRSSPTRSRKRNAALDGKDGTKTNCATSATATSTPVAINEARHDAKLAMNVPSGTPITVAHVTPVRIVAMAFAESFGCTRRPDAAVASVQKPPNAAPSNARPTSMTRKLGAKAEIRFDASSKAVSKRKTRRRSTRPATSIKPGAEIAAIT